MKKLMMAVAIVCATVVANAASHNWDASGYFYWNDESALGTELAGSNIYLFQGGNTELTAMLTALSTTGIDALDGYLGTGGVNEEAYFSFANAADKKISDDGATPDAYIHGYFVAITEDGKYATGLVANPIKVNEGVLATGARFAPDWAVEMPGAGVEGWTTVATTATPEPTSGLLLLLGVAGLALRRRRA